MSRDGLVGKLTIDLKANRVVTVVGTGVSVAATSNQEIEGFRVATWTGLLLHGVKHCRDVGAADDEDVALLTGQIRSGKVDFLINAAETVSQRLRDKGSGVFLGWLKQTVGRLTLRDRTIPNALGALPGVLATLNYDNLLEDATRRRAVTWNDADEVQDVLTGVDESAVLHLHGWFREPDSVVLGLTSYNAVKDDPHAAAVLRLFTIDRTLMFVGCGDTVQDPNFSRLIAWGREALSEVSPRHYLLCRSSEVAGFQARLKDAPWLQPLDYGADYGDLAGFLSGLVEPRPAAPGSPARSAVDQIAESGRKLGYWHSGATRRLLTEIGQTAREANSGEARQAAVAAILGFLEIGFVDDNEEKVRRARDLRRFAFHVLRDCAPGDLETVLRANGLQDVDLFTFDFSRQALDGVSFRGSFLLEADFRAAALRGASFRDAWIRNADFADASLEDADFSGADWFNALHLTEPQLRAVRVGTLLAPPPDVAAMHEYLKVRYRLPFDSWREDVRQNLVAAWADYLRPGGLRDVVSRLNAGPPAYS